MEYGFGVDVGGTTVKIAFFNRQGEILSKWEIPTALEQDGQNILPDIAHAILAFLEREGIAKEAVLGIGIGLPGPVDKNGIVPACDNLGWGSTNVISQLEQLTGLPVAAGNDANLAALGECWKGSGCENMVLITLGTGVGGGIIVDGKPLTGANGAAGEIGHLVVNRSETRRCGCGKQGCAEQYCSATGLVRLASDYLTQNTEESCLRAMPLTAKAVFEAAEKGDTAAQAVLEQFFALLGELIANVCIVLNPRQVVIGGGVSKAGQPLLDGIRRYFDRFMYHAGKAVEFKLAHLGNDAGAYGAYKLLLDKTDG